jgi:hypothetical protein
MNLFRADLRVIKKSGQGDLEAAVTCHSALASVPTLLLN